MKKTSMKLHIRRFLLVGLVSLGLVTTVGAAPEYQWKLAQTWPTNFPIFGDTVAKMAELVGKMSQGQMRIRIDSKNKHKAPFGILDMVKSDQYQMGHSASYYWKGKDLNTLPFTTMPFGMTAPEQYAWFYYGGGMALMKKVYDKHDVYAFPGGNTGNQMGGWFREEITGIDDLKGLKMRIPGFAGEVLSKLGVVVTNIPAGELYTALDRGTIDALEWVGPSLDINMGFHKIAPFYYTGWHEPATELMFIVNKGRFDGLPEHLQAILTIAMGYAAYDMYARSYHESAVNWAAIRKDYPHIKIRTFPKKVMDRMKAENQKLLAEKSATHPLFKEIMDSQAAYTEKTREWTRISDYTYLKGNIIE
uniref:TRAP-type mannitol/chloroaromatic compound transport system, substrate-binding protein n=1 Tax=Candidatus Kentrum eta TaxID=2126337 RepID=A0A450UDE0_9GAMM|nr:MAG: TRAP-type mannitol/chloroaromatic compound transport system, substrate-binding protein [Candidatus Kentron sp. H]VFJ90486.1 MAG: TRAP-type mannitol/chloroaromatic compound transport system, substrate-binding protein [Candidatus Kentron sp. H]VFJ96664.1 MAG: TRAP-type mannitol/chloroaromatic compound transport system, substrate-binding protein [Candidatus Kentron sp. H]